MKIKSFISLILCVMLTSLVVGCDKCDKNSGLNYVDYYKEDFYSKMDKDVIVDSGVAKYCIIIPSDASDIINFAVEDFNTLLKQASGVQLPVIKESSNLPTGISNFISLGKTSEYESRNLNLDLDSIDTDGFYVRVVGHNYYVVGNNDRGTLYGCYDLLKRYVGFRFITKDCTTYKSDTTVKFAEYDYCLKTEFQQRSFLDYDLTKSDGANFYIRSAQYGEFGTGTVVDTPWAKELGNIHTILNYVDRNLYKDSHPEFFASNTNSYANPDINPSAFDDVCYSNGITDDGKIDLGMGESVAKIVLNKIKDYLKEYPSKEFFMLGISDQWNAYCMCDTCKARETEHGTKSAITTMFVNAIAKEINEWVKSDEAKNFGIDHEINIIEFAYYWTQDPPVHKEGNKWVANDELVIPNKNVYIRIAPLNKNLEFSLGDDRQLSPYKNVVEGWSAISDNLMLYDYCVRLKAKPSYYPLYSYLGEQAKYLKSHGFTYWMFESEFGTDGIWSVDLVKYIVSNLWWDVNADVVALKDEFMELYHGGIVAPYAKNMFNILEENNERLKKNGVVAQVFGDMDFNVENYPKETIERLISIADDAQTALNNDKTLRRADKEMYNKRLMELRIIPETYQLINYDTYYMLDGNTNKQAFKDMFARHASYANITSFANGYTVKQYLDTI